MLLTLPGIVVSVDEGGSKEEVQVLRNSGNRYCAWKREIKIKKEHCAIFLLTHGSVPQYSFTTQNPYHIKKLQSGTKGMGFAENKSNQEDLSDRIAMKHSLQVRVTNSNAVLTLWYHIYSPER